MRKRIELTQGTPEWRAWRQNKIGASDVAAVMGESPFKTPLELWQSKMSDSEDKRTMAMQRGIDNEDKARKAANFFLLAKFQPECFENTKYPWLCASLDGWDEKKGAALEIKTPCKEDHEMARNKMVPPHYNWQCQTIMLVNELKDMWYESSYQDDIVFVPVQRDEYFCKKILDETKRFWDRIIEFDPPPETDKDYVRFNDDINLEVDYRYAVEKLNEWEEKRDILKKKALEQVGGRNAYLGGLKITKSLRLGQIDYPEVITEYKAIIARFEALVILSGIDLKKREDMVGDTNLDLDKYRKAIVTSYRIT